MQELFQDILRQYGWMLHTASLCAGAIACDSMAWWIWCQKIVVGDDGHRFFLKIVIWGSGDATVFDTLLVFSCTCTCTCAPWDTSCLSLALTHQKSIRTWCFSGLSDRWKHPNMRRAISIHWDPTTRRLERSWRCAFLSFFFSLPWFLFVVSCFLSFSLLKKKKHIPFLWLHASVCERCCVKTVYINFSVCYCFLFANAFACKRFYV